jgi:polar amino acid transport system permease protein
VTYVSQFEDGLWVTLEIFFGAALLGIVLSIVVGGARLSPRGSVRRAAWVYVEFLRGISALVLLFWIFYALPALGLRLSPRVAGVVALGMYISAYGAEVVRSAIVAVPASQTEACVALHFSPWQRYARVIAPQAFAIALPSGGNLGIELLKGTSLVSLITLGDLTFHVQILKAALGHTTVLFLTLLAIYFVLGLCITTTTRLLERWATRHLRTSTGRRATLPAAEVRTPL